MVARKAPIGFDTYGHLYFAKEVKDQKSGPFGSIKLKVAGNKEFNHQFLWYWILGVFNLRLVVKYQKWINPLLDSFFTVFIYFISISIGFGSNNAIIISLLYLFTPSWFSQLDNGPRIYSLTPRLSSEIFVNIFFIVTLLPLGFSFWIALILGIITSCFVLLSSKFGLQVLVFISPLVSIISNNYTPMIALALSTIISLIISKGEFLKSIKNQGNHLVWYFKENIKGNMPISNRNSLKKLFSKPEGKPGFLNHLGAIIIKAFINNSFTSVLLKMPVLIFGLVLFLYSSFSIPIQLPEYISAPVFAAAIIFVLINVPQLLFLGEAERYLNHVSFFIIAFAAMISVQLGVPYILQGLIAYGVFYWTAEVSLLNTFRDSIRKIEKINRNIIEYLIYKNKPCTIISYPYHAVGIWRIMLETKHKVVFPILDNKNGGVWSSNNWYEDKYPFIKLNAIDRIYSELGANILIIDKKQFNKKNISWSPSNLWKKVEIGEPYYSVYEINE